MKFHENPSGESRVVPCGRADRQTDRQTDMTKLTVAFRNFAKAPKRLEYCFQRRPRETNIFMYFPWPPLEAGLSISTFRFSFKRGSKFLFLIHTLLLIL
jgi:hypothetical protein